MTDHQEEYMSKILIAGATGNVGQHLVESLFNQGHSIRVLARDSQRVRPIHRWVDDVIIGDVTNPSSLKNICRGVDTIISAVGAKSKLMTFQRGSYLDVDFLGNLNLLNEAKAHKVKKFAYVSVFSNKEIDYLDYVVCHKRFEEELMNSGMEHLIVRATPFFSAFQEIFTLAKLGFLPTIGNGENQLNPIHPKDLADELLRLLPEKPTDLDIGGPKLYTRSEIFELAFRTLGKNPRFINLPNKLIEIKIKTAKIVYPRFASYLSFITQLLQVETVAPQYGKEFLEEYFSKLATK